MSSLSSYIEAKDWAAEVCNFNPSELSPTFPSKPQPLDVWMDTRHYQDRLDEDRSLYADKPLDNLILDALRATADADAAEPGDRAVEYLKHVNPYKLSIPPRRFLYAFRKELHKLLCSDDEDSEAKRESILKEAKVGQSSVALTIAAMIAPALGTSAGMIAGAVTVGLAIIGRVGLSAWCATQSECSDCE